MGVPIRIIIFWGLYWGLHILGRYHKRVILGCVGRKRVKGVQGSGSMDPKLEDHVTAEQRKRG